MAEVKSPVNNEPLKKAIIALKGENNPQNLNNVVNEMMRSVLLAPAALDFGGAPAPKPDASGKVALPKDTKFNLAVVNSPENKRYYMAFTDAKALQKWEKRPAQQANLMLRFDDFANMLAKNKEVSGLVINPFSESIRFESPMIASLKAQKEAHGLLRTQTQIKPGDKVTIVELANQPDALLDPICAVLENEPTIAAAYLQIMIVNDTAKSYLLVLDGPQDNKIFNTVAQAARPFLAAGENKVEFNITVSGAPLGQQGMKGSEPFYRKGIGRIYDEDDE